VTHEFLDGSMFGGGIVHEANESRPDITDAGSAEDTTDFGGGSAVVTVSLGDDGRRRRDVPDWEDVGQLRGAGEGLECGDEGVSCGASRDDDDIRRRGGGQCA
jgi:hypothetical protein